MNCILAIASTSPAVTVGQSINDGRNRCVTSRNEEDGPHCFRNKLASEMQRHDDMVDFNRQRSKDVPET
jgi:hypothetical protein